MNWLLSRSILKFELASSMRMPVCKKFNNAAMRASSLQTSLKARYSILFKGGEKMSYLGWVTSVAGLSVIRPLV